MIVILLSEFEKACSKQIGALIPFFRNKAIDMATKRQTFLAIPVNTVLFGCESWALKADRTVLIVDAKVSRLYVEFVPGAN